MSDYQLRPDDGRYDRLSRSSGSGVGIWLAIAAIAILVLLGVVFVDTGAETTVPADAAPGAVPDAAPGASELPLGPAETPPAR